MRPARFLDLLLLAAPATAESWPHRRRRRLDSTSGETGLAATWSAGDDGNSTEKDGDSPAGVGEPRRLFPAAAN